MVDAHREYFSSGSAEGDEAADERDDKAADAPALAPKEEFDDDVDVPLAEREKD